LEEVQSLLERAPGMVATHAAEREIINWVAFMQELDAHPFPTDLDGIKALHATLMAGVLPDAGAFKDGQNFIGARSGEVVFIPSPAAAVPAELTAALDWLHASPLHPILRASLFFMEYQGIHPFRDGNGRTGRALFTWYLHHEGYRGIRYALIDAAFNNDRPPYYNTLHEVETNGYDYTPWIDYLAGIMLTAYVDALAAMELDFDHPHLDARQRDIVAWFRRITTANPQRRVKFADVHAAFPHIAPRSLQRGLANLVQEDVIQREGERRGAVYWIQDIKG
jgi:Fic family protein